MFITCKKFSFYQYNGNKDYEIEFNGIALQCNIKTETNVNVRNIVTARNNNA